MAERKAFDTTRYSHRDGFANDLASLAIESSLNSPLEKRVNPFVLEVTTDQKVVNPALGLKDVVEYYSETSELDRAEKEAGVKIRDCLLFEPDGTLSIWISPPGGPLKYEEGRVVVGLNRETNDSKLLESYGICVDFTSQRCLEISEILNRHTDPDQETRNPEKLRSEIFVIMPPGGKPWEFLRENIPLEKVWDSIESGSAHELKRKATQDAQEISQKAMYLLSIAQTEQDYIRAGAYAEREMMARGWKITSGPCGLTNGDIQINSTYFHSHIQVGSSGEVRGINREMGKFVRNCGKCGKEINEVIRAGYKCSCGGTYKGC